MPLHRIFFEIVIIAEKFKKPLLKKIGGFKNLRILLKYVELPGLSFETGFNNKTTILTTLFRKDVNIGV